MIYARMPNPRARQLRTDMTDAERRLWSLLRGRRPDGHKFRRQHPVGPFIADFACIERMLIIEADGGQHADDPDDQRRTERLETQGWQVVRIWNNEILRNSEGVAQAILVALAECVDGPVGSRSLHDTSPPLRMQPPQPAPPAIPGSAAS